MYLFNGDEYLNRPSVQTTTGIVLVSTSAGCTVQMLMHRNGICTRRFINNTWTEWQSYVTNSEITTIERDAFTNENYIRAAFYVVKRNGIVTISHTNDFKAGFEQNTEIELFTLPEKYRPITDLATTITDFSYSSNIQIMIFSDTGKVKATNLGDTLTNYTPGRFTISYLAK